ncbi:MAG TPA: cation diffusion facilitator family transporter [Candidatus Limnocylindria bacterium]|nr:cation diffusion facilitator family transporter [Candidatus Limnocylindria bacterium]
METALGPANRRERERAGRRASVLGLLTNALLAAVKITAGTLSRSVSITADGFNNLSDTGSILVFFMSLRLARKPGDREHPFGHARIEYIGSLAIGIIILGIGIELLRGSVRAIASPQAPEFSWWILGMTLLSIPVKAFQYRYYKTKGRRYDMPALSASAQDSFNDILITSSVAAGLLVSRFAGVMLDGWLGLGVSLFILFTALKVLRSTLDSLIGAEPDRGLGDAALKILRSYPEILDVHDFVLHNYGPGRNMASVHAEVEAGQSLLDIHEVIDQAEREIGEKLGISILIHMDPVVPDDEPGQETRAQISAFLAGMQPPLRLHDYRVVPGKRVVKLIFDISVPKDYPRADELMHEVGDFARTLDPRHVCVIGIDRDYFAPEGEAQA